MRNPDDQARYERFLAAYNAEETPPWDSGIVPPELRTLVEGPDRVAAGRALDVGCGTGLNSVYLALHGWQVIGVDWVAEAVRRARRRAQAAGLADAQVRFVQGDVTRSDFLAGEAPFDLWLDIGCLHGLSGEAQATYAAHARRLVAPGGWLLLYAWRRHEREGRRTGLDPEEVRALFVPAFTVEWQELSEDTSGETRPAAWYQFVRR
ncbi:MAG: class I SAM-dependent methyltransferase [Anaerolineae bacterium]